MMSAHLRPLSFGEILDGAFTLYRRYFSTFFLTALLPSLPIMAVYLLQIALKLQGSAGSEVAALLGLLSMPASLFAYGFGRAALVRQSSHAYLGGEVSRADGFAAARRHFWPLLGTMLLYVIAIFFGYLMFIVPGILFTLMFFAAAQVTVLEGTSGTNALMRSRELARGGWLRIAGIYTVMYLILYMPMIALGIGAAAYGVFGSLRNITAGTAENIVGWIQLGALLVSALALPLQMCAMTLLYYDRRVRVDALDLLEEPALHPAAV